MVDAVHSVGEVLPDRPLVGLVEDDVGRDGDDRDHPGAAGGGSHRDGAGVVVSEILHLLPGCRGPRDGLVTCTRLVDDPLYARGRLLNQALVLFVGELAVQQLLHLPGRAHHSHLTRDDGLYEAVVNGTVTHHSATPGWPGTLPTPPCAPTTAAPASPR